jgi:ketosteroid isomerase-like protein
VGNEHELIERTMQYLALFEREATTTEELSAYLAEDIVWQEMPNRFAPSGRRQSRAQMLESFARGKLAVVGQRYKVLSIVAGDDSVAVRYTWSGSMARDLGPFSAGTQLRAELASFLRFRGNTIVEQVDYPCYLPNE